MAISVGVGFVFAGIAVLCFGSNFVPVKKFDTGDGLFFQWVLCCAIWMVGMIVQSFRDFPQFEPLAMLGGFLWCTGNVMAVPVIQCIGLGLGMVIWCSTNLLMGWASGTFGLFGMKPEPVPRPALNYAGFVVCVLSTVLYVFVKPTVTKKEEKAPLLAPINLTTSNSVSVADKDVAWTDKLSPPMRRIIGVVLAALSGLFYGVNFDPPQILIDHADGLFGRTHSTEGLDYVFSHFCGIFVTSTLYFLIYCAVRKNRPYINQQVVLPGFLSGVLWAIAQVCWFVANGAISLVIAFPIISTGPGVVASIWGIVVFKEISGLRNYVLLFTAWGATFLGIGLIAASKT